MTLTRRGKYGIYTKEGDRRKKKGPNNNSEKNVINYYRPGGKLRVATAGNNGIPWRGKGFGIASKQKKKPA